MRLLIINKQNYHYEILESIITLFKNILQDKLEKIDLIITQNESFENYIKEKYNNLNIYYEDQDISKYNYVVYGTVYYNDLIEITEIKKNIFYICHEVIDYYDISKELLKQIITLTRLSKNNKIMKPYTLPYQNEKLLINQMEKPIFVIQGNFIDNNNNHNRRNLDLLEDILMETYDYDYEIRLLGRGEVPIHIINHPNVKYLENLNFEDYHKEFLDVFGIIPCISKESHQQYYLNKYTSSISYGNAYNLYFLIDKELDEIYNVEKKIIYDKDDISEKFNLLLEKFYDLKKK